MSNPRYKVTLSLILLLSELGMAYAAGARRNFLSHGPSVAVFGCGEAGTVMAQDLPSVFYNPSLLANFRQGSIALSHYSLNEGSSYNYAAVGYPLGNHFFAGLSAINLASGVTEIRQTINEQGIAACTRQWAYLLTFAKHFPGSRNLNAGVTFKYIDLDLHTNSGGGAGIDAGIQESFPLSGTGFKNSTFFWGAAVQNAVEPTIKLVSENDRFSTLYRASIGIRMPVAYRFLSYDTVSFMGDATMEDSIAHYAAGAEYTFAKHLSLRAGSYDNRITAGAGISFADVQLNYAADFSDYFTLHRIGLNFFLRPGKTDKRKNALMKEARQTLVEAEREQAKRKAELKPVYERAVKEFSKGRYLDAAAKFEYIMLNYPENESAATFYNRILDNINETLKTSDDPDLQRISYAKGFACYHQRNIAEAIKEWEKVLELNPQHLEVKEHLEKARAYIADLTRLRKEKEREAEVKELFDLGKISYSRSDYVACIKNMEKVREFCTENAFPASLKYFTEAQEYIGKALKELSLSLNKSRVRRPAAAVSAEGLDVSIDETGAEKKYKEGLILYAQGKLFDAEKQWEIALRLNPRHEKARKALEKVKQDTSMKQ